MDDWLVSVCKDDKVVGLYLSRGLREIETIKALHRGCDIEGFLVCRSTEKVKPSLKSEDGCRKVICIETGEIFNSVNSCAESIGVPRWNVYRNIQRCYAVDGKHYRYLNESDYG